MVQIHEPGGVTIRTILRDLAATRSLDLELLAGGEGLDRRITIPHTQKTGLALSGFDAYLRDGRVLVFGESEIRYLEGLDQPGRTRPFRSPPRPSPPTRRAPFPSASPSPP